MTRIERDLAFAQFELAAASLSLQYHLTQEDARTLTCPEANPLNEADWETVAANDHTFAKEER